MFHSWHTENSLKSKTEIKVGENKEIVKWVTETAFLYPEQGNENVDGSINIEVLS